MDQLTKKTVQYRKKPPEHLVPLIEEVAELKLYLLAETGPSSFVFRDDKENKIKTSVGNELNCSCSPNNKDHCLHTLWILIKKFKIDPTNPIVWQQGYKENEICDIIMGKFNQSKKEAEKHNYLKSRSKFKNVVQKKNVVENGQQYFRQALEQDAVCPICQEDMKEDQPLTFCKRKCGNNFHIKCIKIWLEHKIQNSQACSCPMCRCDMGSNSLIEVKREEEEYNYRHILHNQKCNGCTKKSIIGNIYHCLLCENINLCNQCYEHFEHDQHSKFLMKQKKDQEWKIANERYKSNFKHQKQLMKAFNDLNGNNNDISDQQRDLFMSNIQKSNIVQQVESKELNPTYYASCFPYTKDTQNGLSGESIQGLSIVGVDVNKNKSSCIKCMRIDQHGYFRKLNCNHTMCDDCIGFLFERQDNSCPICKKNILKGFASAFKKKKSELIQVKEQSVIRQEEEEEKKQEQNQIQEIFLDNENQSEQSRTFQDLNHVNDNKSIQSLKSSKSVRNSSLPNKENKINRSNSQRRITLKKHELKQQHEPFKGEDLMTNCLNVQRFNEETPTIRQNINFRIKKIPKPPQKNKPNLQELQQIKNQQQDFNMIGNGLGVCNNNKNNKLSNNKRENRDYGNIDILF